jgi:hypothetical protein
MISGHLIYVPYLRLVDTFRQKKIVEKFRNMKHEMQRMISVRQRGQMGIYNIVNKCKILFEIAALVLI